MQTTSDSTSDGSARPTLMVIGYSGWSEKARWALDHHGLRYRTVEHMPLLGEPLLRLRLGRLTGPATVPLLITPQGAVMGSFAIAQHAERIGSGTPLLPADRMAEIERWIGRSDEALGIGRALYMERLSGSPDAKRETVPGFVPAPLRSSAAALVDLGAEFLRVKHGVDRAPREGDLVRILEELDAALRGEPYLLGDFTFADIAMAAVLQAVLPVDDRFIPLGPAQRACWTRPALASRFGKLTAWRDTLYARHRHPAPSA